MAPAADTDLRLVRAFVAVADDGNVTRAARRLHLAQQALSAQIQRLERQLGVRLFDRVPEGMVLTAAGTAFLVESRKTLDLAHRAVEAAMRADARPGRRRLTVVYKARATAHLIDPLLASVARRDAQLDLELQSANTLEEELDAVRVGLADVAFVWLPTGAEDLHHDVVGDEPWLVAVGPRHRLAERGSVELAELADEPVVGPHDSVPAGVTAAWAFDPRPDGRAAVLGPIARTPEDCLQLVAAHRGVWFAPESVSGYFVRPSVAWLVVEDVAPAQLAIAMLRDRADASTQTLVDCARLGVLDV